jgi:hypothetical protein
MRSAAARSAGSGDFPSASRSAGARRDGVKVSQRVSGRMSSDAATTRWRRYVETLVKESSVNEASVQYVRRNRASERRTPRGWKKATTNSHTTIAMLTATPSSPSCW